jgi:A/G-specific adenine glycosylase
MLQQTRVAAVIPYYERFLAHFPDYQSLAAAPEEEVLRLWAGLGYYSRARNLQNAARQMVALGGFPSTFEGISALPGIGEYTSAAVASIAFRLPYVVLDGNVLRVMSRLRADSGDIRALSTRKRLKAAAQELLDPLRPDLFNQALMELGAIICLPKAPKCFYCPYNDSCKARLQGLEKTLPIKSKKAEPIEIERHLLWIEKDNCVLLWQRGESSQRMAGFWELPDAQDIPAKVSGPPLGTFRHSIVNHNYRFVLSPGKLSRGPKGSYKWIALENVFRLPLSTVTKKSLKLINRVPPPSGS